MSPVIYKDYTVKADDMYMYTVSGRHFKMDDNLFALLAAVLIIFILCLITLLIFLAHLSQSDRVSFCDRFSAG
jgi:hypothetical protein